MHNKNAWEGYLWSLFKQEKYSLVINKSDLAFQLTKYKPILLIKGWALYKIKKYKKATKIFDELLKQKTKEHEAISGLYWSLKKLGKCDDFYLTYYKKYNTIIPQTIKEDLFVCLAYKNLNINPRKTLIYIDKIKKINPQNKELNKIEFLALLKLRNRKAKEMIKLKPNLFSAANQKKEKIFLSGLENFNNFIFYHREKKGEKGLDKVKHIVFPKISFAWDKDNFIINTNIAKEYITNKEKGDNYQVANLEVIKKNDDYPYYTWKINLGIEPYNAQIKPILTFYFSTIFSKNKYSLDIYRKTVKESLLSNCGIKTKTIDNKTLKWGRTYKTGIKLSKNIHFKNLSCNISLGTNLYDGYNVEKNNEYWINLSIGKYFSKDLDYWFGFFIFSTHFEENQNFYKVEIKDKTKKFYLPAFGHGGYFSPYYLISFGPTLSLKSKDFKKLLWKINMSLSVSFFQEKENKLWLKNPNFSYNKITDNKIKENFSWLKNIPKDGIKLKGNKSSSIGGSISFNSIYLLSERLSFITFAQYARYADYYDWKVGLGLRFYWDKRIKLYFSPLTPTL